MMAESSEKLLGLQPSSSDCDDSREEMSSGAVRRVMRMGSGPLLAEAIGQLVCRPPVPSLGILKVIAELDCTRRRASTALGNSGSDSSMLVQGAATHGSSPMLKNDGPFRPERGSTNIVTLQEGKRVGLEKVEEKSCLGVHEMRENV